jgi:hypothetical protein
MPFFICCHLKRKIGSEKRWKNQREMKKYFYLLLLARSQTRTKRMSFRFKAIQILKLALVFCTVEGNTFIHPLSHSKVNLSILEGLVIWFLSGITQGEGGVRVGDGVVGEGRWLI